MFERLLIYSRRRTGRDVECIGGSDPKSGGCRIRMGWMVAQRCWREGGKLQYLLLQIFFGLSIRRSFTRKKESPCCLPPPRPRPPLFCATPAIAGLDLTAIRSLSVCTCCVCMFYNAIDIAAVLTVAVAVAVLAKAKMLVQQMPRSTLASKTFPIGYVDT